MITIKMRYISTGNLVFRYAVIFMCGLTCASIANAATLYESRFDRVRDSNAPRLKKWQLGDGSYQIKSGWLVVTSQKSNPYATLRVCHDGDGTYRATVRNARACHKSIMFAKGVYRFGINNEFSHLALHRLTEGKWKLVDEVKEYPRYARNTQEFELRLVFVGKKVYGFIDDKKLLEYTDHDPVPAGGVYGLMSGWETKHAWRNIHLSDKPDLTEWPYRDLPNRAPEGLVEVTQVRGHRSDNIYYDGETAGLDCMITTRRKAKTDVRLCFRLIDVRQREVAKKVIQVTLEPGNENEVSVVFQPSRRGCFKIALNAGTGIAEPAWVEDLGSFTIVPKKLIRAERNQDSYFGGHMDGINLEWHLQAGRKLGIQWARCHDALQQGWWTRIQPDGPDQWLWPYDDAQERLNALGFTTLGEFLWVPKWAASKPDSPKPQAELPEDWDAFARYVRRTVEHYRGSIKHWEVWNEPDFTVFFNGTPEDYARVLKICYDQVKSVDPEYMVFGGGGVWPRHVDWVEKMLKAGGGKHMDGFTMHYLEPDIAEDLMPRLKRLLDSHGVTGPIWNSEATVYSTSFFDQVRHGQMEPEARYHFRNACYELVRMYMANISTGVQRIFYYAQVDPWRQKRHPKPRVFDEAPMSGGMWDEGQMLKPIAAAHAALAFAIEGKEFKSRISSEKLHVFFFEAADSATAVQYAMFDTFSQTAYLRFPLPDRIPASNLTVIDFMGNESPISLRHGTFYLRLSREPVYLVYNGTSAESTLKRMYRKAQIVYKLPE